MEIEVELKTKLEQLYSLKERLLNTLIIIKINKNEPILNQKALISIVKY
ncbi:hypothetical protein [Capnocytophaga leadbetteri]